MYNFVDLGLKLFVYFVYALIGFYIYNRRPK